MWRWYPFVVVEFDSRCRQHISEQLHDAIARVVQQQGGYEVDRRSDTVVDEVAHSRLGAQYQFLISIYNSATCGPAFSLLFLQVTLLLNFSGNSPALPLHKSRLTLVALPGLRLQMARRHYLHNQPHSSMPPPSCTRMYRYTYISNFYAKSDNRSRAITMFVAQLLQSPICHANSHWVVPFAVPRGVYHVGRSVSSK